MVVGEGFAQADGGGARGRRVCAERALQVAQALANTLRAAPGVDLEDVVDLVCGSLHVSAAEAGQGQVEAGEGHLPEAALLGGRALEQFDGFVGCGFGVACNRTAALYFVRTVAAAASRREHDRPAALRAR